MKTKKSTLIGIAIVFVMAIAIFTFTGCPEEPEQEFPTEFISDVIVSPKTPNVVKGDSQQFTATVYGTDNIAKTVKWTIETAGKNAGTTIDGTGKLTVAAAETLSSLIVKATSTVDKGKSDTATVRIYNPGELLPTVTGVTVSPENPDVAKGGTQQFTATVTGEYKPAQTVTWSIDEDNTKVGTTISSSGLLTIASDETLRFLQVRATSTVDTSVSGTAAVMISGIEFIEISPSVPTVYPGKTQQFTARVVGADNFSKTVTWTFGNKIGTSVISTGNAATAGGSTISSSGLFTLGHDENSEFLYVVATSTVDTTISVFSEVINGLKIDASSLVGGAIAKFGSARFAVYHRELGYLNDSTYLNWSIVETNKAAGTYIADDANLKVADNETLLNLTVRAALKSDPTIYTNAIARVVTVDRVITNAPNTGVAKGGSLTITATVHGENNPPQDVTWRFYNESDIPLDPETTVNFETGLITIGAGEKNKSIRLQAVAKLVPGSTAEYGIARIYTYNPNAGTGFIVEVDDALYDGNGRQTITLSNLKYNEIFLSKVNPTGTSLASGGIYSHLISPSAMLRLAPRSNVQNKTPPYAKGHPAITAFNANPPAITPALRAKLNTPKPEIRLSGSTVGQTKNFWVGYNGNDYVERQATLLAAGTHGNIWVVGNRFSADLAQIYADKFDILYLAMTNVFGYEYGGGPGGDGGRDGDTKVQILFCDMPAGTGIAGYFHSVDFYDQATLNAAYGNNRYRTNEAEIFYMGVTAPVDEVFDTLAHEFQHMINFNQKFVIQGGGVAGTASPTWYDEMLSLVAEDLMTSILGFDINTNAVVFNFFMDLFFGGLTSASNSLPIWGGGYGDYGNKYAFGAYLLRNYGGAPLIKAMLANNTTGIASIDAALQQLNPGVTFEKAFSRYGEALIYGFRNAPDGANIYEKPVSNTVNGITYDIMAFNPWGYNTEKSFYSNSNSTLLPYSVQIETPVALRGNEILGSVDVTITKPANGVKLYLLVK